MWKCEKCGREFKKTNQGHYCGKAPENVDEYIAAQPENAREYIAALRAVILRFVPEVKEGIAWSMPRYQKNGRSLCFAACKKHISLYVDDLVLETFQPQLTDLTVKKNAVYLPYDKALPESVVEGMVKQTFGIK